MAGQRSFRQELKGAKELEAALRTLPKRTGKNVVRRSLLKAAGPIATIAKAILRAGTRNGSGDLESRIQVGTQLSRRQKRSRARGAVKGLVTVYVGAGPARHAHLKEFGSGPRRQKSGKSTGTMPASPFMRPAWEAGKRPALRDFGRFLWVEIEKAARRVARKALRAARG